ncbi:trypsin-like peptidase domain-containing protein, partial [Bacteroidota bacterium]
WQLNIVSKGAYSINLIYNYFDIPEGAKLFVYNKPKDNYIGAFTSRNVKNDKTFATFLVKGESIIVEYYEPASVKGLGKIAISKVIHGYKDFYSKLNKGYGSSGSCNNNANCPEGEGWQNEKRSVAMILLSSNTRWCSGSLINNVHMDGTPYFLTANHCLGGENTWIIMFNYESIGCENQDGPTNQTIQNTTLLASNSSSDFALVQLSETPPVDYNVYYSGWTRHDTATEQSVGIHHPSGDIKKISFDYDPTTSSDYDPSPYLSNSHWEITAWDDGTTEGGSSGSPLYDQNHRIVGQLHGGWASCSSITPDFYGKFSMSWDHGTTSSNRLKDWLDPDNTDVMTLNGWDPFSDNLDAEILKIIEPESRYCGEASFSVNPKIVIRNAGLAKIDSLTLNYKINDEVLTFIYSDSIPFNITDTITLPVIEIDDGEHTITVNISSVNGLPDEDHTNDTIQKEVSVISNPTYLNLNFYSGNHGNQNYWQMLDANDNVIYRQDVLQNNTLYEEEFCLDTGCYAFKLFNDYSNGLSANAYYELVYPESNYIIKNEINFETEDFTTFCIYETPIVNFEVEDTMGCMNQEIQFNNNSVGEILSEWHFEEGVPEISFEKNPRVYFSEIGDHNIKLKVYGTTGNDSLMLDDYIYINPSPQISFTVTAASDSSTADGSVTAIGSEGTSPYSYRWNTGSLNNTLSDIQVGWYYVTVSDDFGCKSSDSIYIFITDIEIIDLEDKLIVYPTISDGTLYITSKDESIDRFDISDIYGKIIYRNTDPELYNIVHLPKLDNGIYFIRFFLKDEMLVRKFVLK